jgi:hypothetical protein
MKRRWRRIIRVIIIVFTVPITQQSTTMETLHCSLPRQVVTVYLCQIYIKPACNCSCKQASQDASSTVILRRFRTSSVRGFKVVDHLPRRLDTPRSSVWHSKTACGPSYTARTGRSSVGHEESTVTGLWEMAAGRGFTTLSNCIAHRQCDTGHFTLQFTATINHAVPCRFLWVRNLVIHIDG